MNQQRTINRPDNPITGAGKDLLETTCSHSMIDVFNIPNKCRLFVLLMRNHDVGLPLTVRGSQSVTGDLELTRARMGECQSSRNGDPSKGPLNQERGKGRFFLFTPRCC